MRRLMLGLVVAALIVSGCRGGNEDPNNPLYDAILDTVPKGYRVEKGPASGPMKLEDASRATASDAVRRKNFLRRNGYQDGYSRVWTREETRNDYIKVLAHEMSSPEDAVELVNFEVDQLRLKRGVTFFNVTDIQGARGYILSGSRPGQGGQSATFCQGIIFARGSRVFHLDTCSAQPNSPETVKELAKEQEAKNAKAPTP